MRRRVGLFLFCGLVLPLIVTASASAQGAVLRVSKQVVTVGETVTLEGTSFSAAAVDIRIGPTRDSPSYRDTNGPSFVVDFVIPPLPVGWHLIQATQVTERDRARGFTPGRARIRVVPAAAAAAGVPPGGGSTGEGPPTPLVVAIIGLALLAGTSTLMVRRLRTFNRPLGS